MKKFGRTYDCHAIRVKAALANGFEESKSHGRHFVFDDDSEEEILSWIEERAEKSRPMTRTDILHYCEVKYSRSVKRGWMNVFFCFVSWIPFVGKKKYTSRRGEG
jgi:hypothetical protein